MKKLELEQKFEDFMSLIGRIKNPILKEIAKNLLLEHKTELMNRAGSPDCYENGKYIAGGHHFLEVDYFAIFMDPLKWHLELLMRLRIQ